MRPICLNNFGTIQENLSSYSYSDSETKEALKELYQLYGYVADPHGAVGYLGCKNYLKVQPDAHCVFLETAHPTKFLDVVEEVIDKTLELPSQIQSVINKEKVSVKISSYADLKHFLLNQ